MVRQPMGGISAPCCRPRTGSSWPNCPRRLAARLLPAPWSRITEVIYKVTAPWERQAERGVIWNDPALAIPWPFAPAEAILSLTKDRALPRLAECSEWHVS